MNTKKEKEVEPYNVSIKILGKVHTSTGNSVKEALEKLKPEGKCVGTSILSISHGEKTKDRVLGSMQVMRLFSPSRLMKEIAIKNVSLLFDQI